MVLVTGATGFIGARLLSTLSQAHDVVSLSRGEVAGAGGVATVRGDFARPEDLRALDGYEIDTAVHLAAVLETAPEEECLVVNVLGTATLLRYLLARGCRHLILASSIAATGCLSAQFVPRQLPIGDDHPCDAVDPYGMSKGMVEELALYLHRQTPDLEVAMMRIGGTMEPGPEPYRQMLAEASDLPFLVGGLIAIDDVVAALALAVDRRLGPGARRFNLVQSPSPVYATGRVYESYGFRASTDVQTGRQIEEGLAKPPPAPGGGGHGAVRRPRSAK